MKEMLTGVYPFDATAGTIDFSSVSGFSIKSLIGVVNQTTGAIIYGPTIPGRGGSVIGSTLALQYDTSMMNNSDTLLVFYDRVTDAATVTNGRMLVDGSGVTQPVSAAALPLPTGAATEARQATGNASLASIDAKAPALVSGRVPVDGSAVTQPVSAAALPLPSGAATSAKQDTGNTSLASIDSRLSSALPLPTGAATEARQATSNSSLSSIDAGIGGATAAAAGDTGASTVVGFLRWLRDWFVGKTGTKTAAASLSVTGASDWTQAVKPVPRIGASGTINSPGSSVVLTLVDGINSVVWQATAGDTITATLGLYASTDGGSTYPISVLGRRLDNASSGPGIAVGWAGSVTNYPLACNIPPGATHMKVMPSAYSSGSTTVTISGGPEFVTDFVQASATLLAGVSRIGNVATAGIWYDDTSSALSGAASFTSTSRDVTATATATAIASATAYAKEYRVLVVQDVTFTLYLEVSRDNSTFRRIKQVVAAQNVTSGLYIAELRETPAWRYYRYVITNGASAAGHTTGGSILLAA